MSNKFNIVQEYLVEKFKEGLSENEFSDLKFLIDKYFAFNICNRNIIDSKQKMQIDELAAYRERLLNLSSLISMDYFKLSYLFPTNNDLEKWILKEKEWCDYRDKLYSKCFFTKDSILKEIETVTNEYQTLVEVRKRLDRDK